MASEREYEIILLGATGYTGVYGAEHVVKYLPTDLKWAVAGRSSSKLEKLVADITILNPDRIKPGIEICSLSPEDLDALAKKTICLVSTVGPYHLYGTPVVESCARNGTHYLDCTGETPWVKRMIEQYHDLAKQNNAVIVPECGFESAPFDLIAYCLATHIRTEFSAPTKSVITSLHDIDGGVSGGTALTILSILDSFSISELQSSMKPYSLAATKPSTPSRSPSFLTRLFGVRKVPELGTLTTGVTGSTNAAIVQRTWSLMDNGDFYGQNFRYDELMRVSSVVAGAAIHITLAVLPIFLLISPLRWVLKKVIPSPGQGPSLESTKKNHVEIRSVGVSDSKPEKRALATLKFQGSMYDLTGRWVIEGALVLARGNVARLLGGGCLTPAMLGQGYVDRMAEAGMEIVVEDVDS